MPRAAWIPFVTVAVVLSVGCVSTKDIDTLRRDINDVRRAVHQGGQKNVEEVTGLADKIDKQSRQLLKSNADLGSRIDDLVARLQSLNGQLEETNHRLSQLSQEIAVASKELESLHATAPDGESPPATAPGASLPPTSGATAKSVPPVSPAAPATGSGKGASSPRGAPAIATPQDLFRGAYADYLRGNYDLAIAGFREYVETYPKTDSTASAYYWVGECYFSQKKYREAINEFDVVATRFPKSDKAASALLKKGYAYLELGEKGRGTSQFQYVVREYPGSEEAALARQKMKSLGVEIR